MNNLEEHIIIGSQKRPVGESPGIILTDPKFPHNLGAIVRAASCFDIKQVWFTGNRIQEALMDESRIPRELRMKDYKDVEVIQSNRPFEAYRDSNVVPVAVEFRDNSEMLPDFVHPENAVYVFGPEDGSIPQSYLRQCHRFVILPTKHCINVSAAVHIILYDRLLKKIQGEKR